MRIRHSASRTLALAALLALGLGAGACSKDNGPSEFNPDGMSGDMSASAAAFNAPVTQSFGATGTAMATVLGGAAPAVVSPAIALLHPATTKRYAASLARLLPKARGLSASVATIPSEVLGTTFVWDLDTQAYVASDAGGAPSNGVRFLLYAVNPVTLEPVDPLDELGYVDVTDVGAGATTGIRVVVVSGDVTYLDYTVTGTGTEGSGTVAVEGFASNGTEQVNYTLQNTVANTPNGMVLTLDFGLSVPSRHFSVTYTATFANLTPDDIAVTLDFRASGRNGDVRISGTYTADGGTFSVQVNGELFATITIGTGEPVITGANGTELTASETAALQAVLMFYDGSLSVFSALLEPVM
jgi:hypothetical protein